MTGGGKTEGTSRIHTEPFFSFVWRLCIIRVNQLSDICPGREGWDGGTGVSGWIELIACRLLYRNSTGLSCNALSVIFNVVLC